MTIDAKRLVLGLAAFNALDAVACAIPAPYIKRDLDRLGCPENLQRALPVVKGAAAIGLVAGMKEPRLGRLTSAALVAYFGCAVGFHVRAHDHPIRSVPAATLGAVAALSFARAYR